MIVDVYFRYIVADITFGYRILVILGSEDNETNADLIRNQTAQVLEKQQQQQRRDRQTISYMTLSQTSTL